MKNIDIHADDYALTVNTSKDMLECMKAGKLNSISIVPNTSVFEECMELLYQEIPTLPFLPLMSVHLDFVEGYCLAGKEKAPLLVRENSDLMGLSWGGVFQYSYIPWKRNQAKTQLKAEIKEQIAKVQQAAARCIAIAKENQVPCEQKGLRIDSHQHAHMIPVVWDALLEVLKEENYLVEYIRNSKEVLWAFVSEVSLWKSYRPVNFVKNRLLSLYSHKVDRYYREHRMEQMYLWGLVMSGNMDEDRIRQLYGKVSGKAQKDNRRLEILFHPGLTLPAEVNEEIGKEAAEEFYLSKGRKTEYQAVMNLTFPPEGK